MELSKSKMKNLLAIVCVFVALSATAQQNENRLIIEAENSLDQSNALTYIGIGLGFLGTSLVLNDKPKTGQIILYAATVNLTISVFKHRNATRALINHQKQF